MRDHVDRRLPHLSGLPHLPGSPPPPLPRFHVNRPLESTPENFPNTWKIEFNRISGMKVGGARIQFSSDISLPLPPPPPTNRWHLPDNQIDWKAMQNIHGFLNSTSWWASQQWIWLKIIYLQYLKEKNDQIQWKTQHIGKKTRLASKSYC